MREALLLVRYATCESCVAIKALAGDFLCLMALGSVSLLSRSLLVPILFNLCVLVGVVDQSHVYQLAEAPVFDLVPLLRGPSGSCIEESTAAYILLGDKDLIDLHAKLILHFTPFGKLRNTLQLKLNSKIQSMTFCTSLIPAQALVPRTQEDREPLWGR